MLPLSVLAKWATKRAPLARDDERGRRSIDGVMWLRRHFGAGRDCLHASLLLCRELTAAGLEPVLHVGFLKNDDRLRGHSWVEVAGHPVGEDPTGLDEFSVIATFKGSPLQR